MTPEFKLIQRFFTRPTASTSLGVGDDAALVAITSGMELAISTDMLVAGTHFFPDTDPRKLGWKTLAVNLSDLAAMGSQPRWATLALSLPEINETWLKAFSEGFFSCANQFGVELIGGDTTRGPLNLSVTILGEVPKQQALRRDAAQAGDDIWISGTLGGAALGLAALQSKATLDEVELATCLAKLETPQPRVALGLALHGIANAAIDISDGLLADLGHVLERSHLGAEILFGSLPAHPALNSKLHENWAQDCLLAGGDDYELCFTASPAHYELLMSIGAKLELALTCIGKTTQDGKLKLIDSDGAIMPHARKGYDHFA